MFRPEFKDVFSWEVPDAEFGELMQGHMLVNGDSYVLIDPPLMPELLEKTRISGTCSGVIVLGASHKRGGFMASRLLDTRLYFPKYAAEALGDVASTDIARLYSDGDSLPEGLKAVEIKTEIGIFGEHPVHEMVLLDEKGRAFIGDVCHGTPDGRLELAPEGIFPGYTQDQVKASLKALLSAVPLDSGAGFFGHGRDLLQNFGALISKRKEELKL